MSVWMYFIAGWAGMLLAFLFFWHRLMEHSGRDQDEHRDSKIEILEAEVMAAEHGLDKAIADFKDELTIKDLRGLVARARINLLLAEIRQESQTFETGEE